MSKIAELLKLAEKKKEDTKIKLPSSLLPNPEVGVSIGKQEQVRVSTDNSIDSEVGVSNTRQEQVSISKSKEGEARGSKGNNDQHNITPKSVEISPTRDYTKVSNSIMKRAIPEKYFRGLSKHTYDVLYQRTRGAITPTRTIQLTKDELVRLTGISKDAIKLHIKYLKETGLLKSRPAIGSHAGWEYEILVPEEIEETEQVGVWEDKVRQGKVSENLPLHSGQNLPPLTHTNPIENKDAYEFSKTSLKTNTKNDDECRGALAELAEKLDAVSKKLTGKGLSARENEKWGTLADLLVLELEVAAKKTDSISSIPAFLAELLRRQFFTLQQQGGSSSSLSKLAKTKPDTVGKSDSGSYEIKALNQKSREAALEQLVEFADEEFLQDFKKWYTPEDWSWLIEQLKK